VVLGIMARNYKEAEISKIMGKEAGRQAHRFFSKNIYERR